MTSLRNGEPRVLSASTICSDAVVNSQGESLGEVEELMIDLESGRIAYAVLSFGGFLGMGNKLFAVPWEALQLDADNHCFVLNVPREKLEQAPGFDQDDWPDFADPRFGQEIYRHYDIAPPASR
jgi:sporulation protein YlmC with PRC-barrel domain